MNKISEIKTDKTIDIPENAKTCAIVLFIDSSSAGQTSVVWSLDKESCLAFSNNQSSGCAYIKNDKIILENVIAYIVFFN